MNHTHKKPLPGTTLHYIDARAAVDALSPGAWARMPYTARVHAENLVRRADPAADPAAARDRAHAAQGRGAAAGPRRPGDPGYGGGLFFGAEGAEGAIPERVEDAMADLAMVFHWRPADMEDMSLARSEEHTAEL